ncbi:MAG: CBS domain-containing protein [Planctomycetota bacterium]
MKIVQDILWSKGNDVWSVAPSASVYDALVILAEKDVGALVVLDEGELIGMLSERDYARKVILRGKSSTKLPVSMIMSTSVVCVPPTQSVTECMALMTEQHIRHLPVIEDDRLIGLISIGDVVKAVISEQQVRIGQLEDYIRGG